MICNTLKEAAVIIAEDIVNKRNRSVSVNVTPEVLCMGSVLHEVCEADPRLILCIKTIQIQVENYDTWAKQILHIEYTDNLISSVMKVDTISELREVMFHAAGLHSRDVLIVYPINMYDKIEKEGKCLLESYQMLNCFVSGFSSEIQRTQGCRYMAQSFHIKYSCSYREWINQNQKMEMITHEIVRQAKSDGIEDWKKAYSVVCYCVNNWQYGRIEAAPKLGYTAYSAIVNKIAVCMGLSLAICIIFKELGIPCRYVRGERNGVGHAWNMVFIRGGWFYIDVTDAICRKDPLYHWGMTSFQDRTIVSEFSDPIICNCPPEFIRSRV